MCLYLVSLLFVLFDSYIFLQLKLFCEGLAAVIPVYLNEEPVFVEFYNLSEIAVQVSRNLQKNFL
jgi:hypothetical protein